jgi:cell division septation protein DedD
MPAEQVATAIPVVDIITPATAALPDVTAAPMTAPAATPPALAASRWSVQLGAFAQAANAESLRDRIAEELARNAGAIPDPADHKPRVEHHGSIFRVLIGDLVDRAAALQLAQRLERVLSRETTVFSR